MILVDTSAFFALADRSDRFHEQATATWDRLAQAQDRLATHSFVVVETTALLHRRLSHESACRFLSFVEGLKVLPVDRALLAEGVTRFRRRSPSGLSLVDCVSFSLMRTHDINRCFTFDRHFADEGFELLES